MPGAAQATVARARVARQGRLALGAAAQLSLLAAMRGRYLLLLGALRRRRPTQLPRTRCRRAARVIIISLLLAPALALAATLGYAGCERGVDYHDANSNSGSRFYLTHLLPPGRCMQIAA